MNDLEGMLVVSLEQAVAAPYASCKLADAGARVIKIEREEGDFARNYDKLVHGQSSYFVWLNRGKQSLCLDVKNEADNQLLLKIISKADVFIQNLAPGAIGRLGLAAKTLTEKFPSLIYCSLSGYGEEGPYREQKAYDMLVQGESGLISVNGTVDGVARVGISVCDISAGMTAYAAIVQSLFARSRTGKGRIIEVSLFHAIADWMNVPYLQSRYGNKPPPRVGVRHPTISPYGAFMCSDGKAVLLSIQNEREWLKLCSDVLGRALMFGSEDYAADMGVPSRAKAVEHAAALVAIAASAAGKPAFGVAGSLANFSDLETFKSAIELTRDLGFGGALAIHPAQLTIIKEVFTPTPSDIRAFPVLFELHPKFPSFPRTRE